MVRVGYRPGSRGIAASLASVAVLVLQVATATTSQAIDALAYVRDFTPSVVSPDYVPSEFKPYAAHLRLAGDEIRRRLYTIDDGFPSFVATYSLDTLHGIGDGVQLSGYAQTETVLKDLGWLLVATAGTAGTAALDVVGSGPAGATLIGSVAVPAAGLGSPDHQVVGLAPVPGRAMAFAIAYAPQTSGTVTISLIDLDGIEAGGGSVLWTEQIPSCYTPMTAYEPAALGYVPEQTSVYFGCGAPTASLATPSANLPVPAGVGRLRVSLVDGRPSQAEGFTLFPRESDFRLGASAYDPVTRRLLLSAGRSSTGWVQFSFDTLHEAWVGSLALGGLPVDGNAVGQSAARLYARSGEVGILVADAATTPLEQGRNFPDLANKLPDRPDTNGFPGVAPMYVDDGTRRLFLPPYAESDNNGNYADHWYVLQDQRPAYVAPPTQDPDAITVDVPEAPGRTDRTFSLSAQGFGTRTTQVGGTGAAAHNTTQFRIDGIPSSGTRKLATAYLDKVVLNGGEATARAIAADRDEGTTGADQQKTCVDGAEEACEWPVSPAQCEDFGGGVASQNLDESSVSCDLDSLAASAASTGRASETNGVGAESSHAEAELRVDADEGAVATVLASADGIGFLDGAVTIGRVETQVTVSAHGRPGTAVGSFGRSVRDVRVGGQLICGDDCDVEEVANTINERFTGYAQVQFPEPDPALLAGSPGGAVTVVRRTEEEQVEAVALNQLDPQRVEVPGMVLTMYADNEVPSRSVYEFAGAAAEVRYGIFELNGGAGDSSTSGSTGGGGGATTGARLIDDGFTTGTGGSTGPIHFPSDDGAIAAPPSAPRKHGLLTPVGPVLEEFRALLVNDPLRAGSLLLIWLLLLAPVYLSARRWTLRCRDLVGEAGS